MNWTNLTSGLLGSALGALLTFLAAIVTIGATNRAARNRAARRAAETDERHRHEAVAEVLGTFQALELETRMFPLLRSRSVARMLEATMRFHLITHAAHPEVADWLLEQHAAFGRAVDRWHRRWWMPWGRSKRGLAAATLLGEVIGALVMWATGVIPDESFADPMRQPGDIAKRVGAAT